MICVQFHVVHVASFYALRPPAERHLARFKVSAAELHSLAVRCRQVPFRGKYCENALARVKAAKCCPAPFGTS